MKESSARCFLVPRCWQFEYRIEILFVIQKLFQIQSCMLLQWQTCFLTIIRTYYISNNVIFRRVSVSDTEWDNSAMPFWRWTFRR